MTLRERHTGRGHKRGERSARRWWSGAIVLVAACLMAFPRPSSAQSDEWKFLFDGYAYSPWMEEKLNLGMEAARREDWESAIKHFKGLEADIQIPEPTPVEGFAAFGLGFAYDNAGGRELLAITWYRAYLGSAHPKPWDSQERLDKARRRVKELDDQAEGAVRKLIGIAERQLLQLAPTQRETYSHIARAQAAIGDFDAAKASLRAACNSIWTRFDQAWQAGYAGAARDADSYTKALASIAMSQWKYGDTAGALETLDDPSLHCTVTNPGNQQSFQFTDPVVLDNLRLLFAGDWSALQSAYGPKIRELFGAFRDLGGFSDKILYKTMGEFLKQWDDLSPRSFIVECKSVCSNGWFFLLDEWCYGSGLGWAHENWVRIAGDTSVSMQEGGPCDLLAEYETDWRVLAKRRESPYPTTTVRNLAELALDMAEALHFLRARNASLARQEGGWIFE